MTGDGRAAVLGVAAAALAIRVATSLAIGFNPAFFDADSYHRLAMEGVAGGHVSSDGHPPGYSWFLMTLYRLVGVEPRAVYGLQIVIAAGVVLLVGDAARRRFGPRAGVLAASLLAFSGPLAIYPSLLLSENVCLAGVALVAWLVLPRLPEPGAARLLGAAAVVAALSLTRTGLVLLAVPLAFLALASRRRGGAARSAALAAGVLAVVAVPLLLYSWVRSGWTGAFRIGSAADVYSFYLGNNPEARGRAEPMTIDLGPDPPPSPDMETAARLLGPKARSYLLRHPVREAELFVRRASFNFAPNKKDLLYLYGHGWAGERRPAVVEAVYVWVAMSWPALAAALLLAFARRGVDAPVGLALAFAAAGILPYQVSIGDARYLIPFHPFLAFAAGSLLAPAGPHSWAASRRLAAGVLAVAFLANAVHDVARTDGALRAIARPGGSALRPPYHFAR